MDTVTVEAIAHITRVGTKKSTSEIGSEVLSQVRTIFLDLINQERLAQGVHTLEMDDRIREGTQIRAEEAQEKFSHTRPNGARFHTAFENTGYKGGYYNLGENIAQNYTHKLSGETAQDLALKMFTQFKNSPGHYANMLTDSYKSHNFELTEKVDENNPNYIMYYGAHIFSNLPAS